MFDALYYLGAVTPQQAKAKAVASGQRAVAAAQRIAKKQPKLAATIARAGQRAISAGSAKKPATSPVKPPAAATPAAPAKAPVKAEPPKQTGTAPAKAQLRPQPQSTRTVQRVPVIPLAKKPLGSFPLRPSIAKTHVGDDAESEEWTEEDAQQIDLYSNLADAAVMLAELVAELQGVQQQLPQNIPLASDGQAKIDSLHGGFGNTFEAILSGASKLNPIQIQALADLLQGILEQRDRPGASGVWAWLSQANAYLRVHPPASQQQGDTTLPGTTGTPASTANSVVIQPQAPVIAPGVPQQFTATVTDTSGQPVIPTPAVTWSVSPSGVNSAIDAAGNFLAKIMGNYTVTANSSGLSASTTVQVTPAAAQAIPAASTYGGGFSGGGGGYSGGSGGDSYYEDAGYEYYGDDDGYADQGYYVEQYSDEQYAQGANEDYYAQGDEYEEQYEEEYEGLDMMGLDAAQVRPVKFGQTDSVLFVVDKSTRGDGTYVLHGVGDASGFGVGNSLYTPDGIIWRITSVDADKKGLTVTKKRDEVSLAAWLSGDWSKLTGSPPVNDETFAQRAAQTVDSAATGAGEALKGSLSYLPWLIGGAAALGLGVATIPLLAQSRAALRLAAR